MNKISLFTKLLLLTAVLFAFASCQEKKTYRIGVSQCSSDDWRNKMNEEINREVILHDDVEVEIRSAEDDINRQISDIQYFMDNDFDAIIAAPIEAVAVTPIIRKVYESGLPIVVFDRNTTEECYTAFQGADNVEIGKQVAKLAISKLGTDFTAVEIRGREGSTPAEERHNGFEVEVKKHPGIKVLASVVGNWEYDDSHRLSDSLFRIYKDVDLVYAHNDRMAIAAANVLKKYNMDKTMVIGVDAAPEIGIKAVADSVIDATFFYPTEGEQLLRTALHIVKGEPYIKKNIMPIQMAVDESNAELLLLQNQALKSETEKIAYLKGRVDDYWTRHSSQTTMLYIVIAMLILLALVVFLLMRAYWSRERNHRLLNEQNRQLEESRDKLNSLYEQLKDATQSKLMFFTNVSHDLRTPLTLIADPVEQISEATNLTDRQRTLMRLADKNIKILMRLINQILDFRKFENGKLTLNLSEVDLRNDVSDWAASFKNAAIKKHIHLSVDMQQGADFRMAVDIEKFERIFFNLLSNAFKFTPENGKIKVAFAIENEQLKMTVSDTGRGMSAEDVKLIFNRFYQVDKVNPQGSGIGLALVKAFVQLHDGEITVDSEEGVGSTFKVVVPVRHVSDKVQEHEQLIASEIVTEELTDVEAENIKVDEGTPTVLVIDDNSDIRTLVQGLFADKYAVIQASNGSQGIKLASKYIPDLIICDVMMPGIDGMETCRRLKNEITTSHIPVLMLTACSLDEQRVEGYDSGADGYLSKPFNSKVLLARCESLIENRKRVKSSTTSDVAVIRHTSSDEKKPVVKDIDSEFYNQFVEILEAKMSDPELSVEDLAAEMGLSRVQFYRKLKSLTNYSPAELLRNARLKRADTLLKTTERTVSEISYDVGFSSPSYFTKCYRDYYGELPTAVQKRTSKMQ
jgi:signal transduction histidine kinase/DNA-binding response OmpR family regulator/ABC-type xylose transport system substrate-binding protein